MPLELLSKDDLKLRVLDAEWREAMMDLRVYLIEEGAGGDGQAALFLDEAYCEVLRLNVLAARSCDEHLGAGEPCVYAVCLGFGFPPDEQPPGEPNEGRYKKWIHANFRPPHAVCVSGRKGTSGSFTGPFCRSCNAPKYARDERAIVGRSSAGTSMPLATADDKERIPFRGSHYHDPAAECPRQMVCDGVGAIPRHRFCPREAPRDAPTRNYNAFKRLCLSCSRISVSGEESSLEECMRMLESGVVLGPCNGAPRQSLQQIPFVPHPLTAIRRASDLLP
jgi:hypothetical protein